MLIETMKMIIAHGSERLTTGCSKALLAVAQALAPSQHELDVASRKYEDSSSDGGERAREDSSRDEYEWIREGFRIANKSPKN